MNPESLKYTEEHEWVGEQKAFTSSASPNMPRNSSVT